MGIEINMGRPKFAERNGRGEVPLVWDPGATISPHAVIVGSSGTGKTYRLRYIIKAMISQAMANREPINVHILDVHGDIAPDARNRIVFSEATDYGLNPLEIEMDPEFGGIRKRINAFVSMINRTSHKLGPRQEAVMRALLKELYERNGYDQRNPRTWNPRTNPQAASFVAQYRRHPGITQLALLAEWRTKNLIMGAGSKAINALNEVNKSQKKLYRLRKKGDNADETAIGLAKANLKEMMCAYVDELETGFELDEVLNFDNVETMKAILERVRALDDAGIFKDEPPVFTSNDPLRVYDIKALQEDEQKMFAEVLMERLFIEAKARGPRAYPDTFVVLDEAHKFMSPDNEHVLNRMAREIRKFGVGLVIVSQNFDHFPEDIIANSAMTMILGMHDMHHDKAARKLGLERKRLSFIKPQQTALIQIRSRSTESKLTNSFTDITLP
jgi:DNA helicase HerA-like ATPase